MNSARNITVAFTGHRTYCGEADELLRQTIEKLYEEGFSRFLCGMAWGWDLAAGEIVTQLKESYSDIQLVAVMPYADFGKLFSGEDLELFSRVAKSADEVIVVSEQGGDVAFRRRNDFLVDNSSFVVAWWDEIPRGGTAYTLRRARHARLPVINLMQSPQLEFEF